MGIDPLTHKPLPCPVVPNDDQIVQSSVNEPQEKENTSFSRVVEYGTIKVVNDTVSIQSSTITNVAKDELEDSEESIKIGKASQLVDFCTDEVPLIEPHEILLPTHTNTLPPLSSLSSSSSTSSNYDISVSNKNFLQEELQQFLASLECCSSSFQSRNYNNFEERLWDDDEEFLSSLNMLVNDQNETDTFIQKDIAFTQDLSNYSRINAHE